MSLDLYIISKKPITKKGTGVYIRENGETRELETVEEVKKYFPNAEDIEEKTYTTDEIWRGNMTHNLGRMAEKVCPGKRSLYTLFWHPSETRVTDRWVSDVMECFVELSRNKSYYKPMEEENRITEENGNSYIWGTYESLYKFTRSLISCVMTLDYENTDYELVVSR